MLVKAYYPLSVSVLSRVESQLRYDDIPLLRFVFYYIFQEGRT